MAKVGPAIFTLRDARTSLWPRQLARRHADTLISVVTAFLQQSGILVSGVLIARLLGAEDRGRLQLLSIPAVIGGQMGLMGMPLAATFYIARQPGNQKRILATLCGPFLLMAAFLITANAIVFALLLSSAEASTRGAAAFMLLATGGALLQVVGLAILQGQQRFIAFNIMRSVQLSCYAVAAVALYLVSSHSLELAAAGWAFGFVAGGALSLGVALLGKTVARPSEFEGQPPPTFRQMLSFGVKSIPGSIHPFENFRLDQILVGLIAGPAALGLYVVGLALTNLPRFVAQSVGMVAYPKIASSRNGHLIAIRYALLVAAMCGAIVLALELACGRLLPLVFGAAYSGSVPLAHVLLISAFLLCIRRILNDSVRGLGRPEFGFIAEVLSWLPLIPVLLLLPPSAMTVAWALVASSLTSAGVLLALLLTDKSTYGRTRVLSEVTTLAA